MRPRVKTLLSSLVFSFWHFKFLPGSCNDLLFQFYVSSIGLVLHFIYHFIIIIIFTPVSIDPRS